MKFLSDILAKAGLTVDGVVTFNNTATGQTPATNDNSTKLATTAFIKNQSYLTANQTITVSGDATGSGTTSIVLTLANSGVTAGTYGNASNIPTITVDAKGRITSISTNAVSIVTTLAGLSDVTLTSPSANQVLQYDGTKWVNGAAPTTYTLPIATASVLGGIKVGAGLSINPTTGVLSASAAGISTRDIYTFTATAGQTTFSCSYTVDQVDVFYNGSKLGASEFTATNGTSVVLNIACKVGDYLEIVSWVAGAGLSSSRTITINGVTYDLFANRSWSALPVGGTTGQILTKSSGTDYDAAWMDNYADWTSVLKHRVKASEAITKGQAVYVSSADGTNMIVSKASNATEGTSSKTMGLLESTVSTNGIANVITEGLLAGLNTATANAGDPVWLGTGGNLIYGLLNKPVAPAHLVFIGVVTRSNANNGEIFVKVQNGFELDELHDLSVKNASDGDMIKYVASTGLWTKIAATTTNITEGTNLYYTQARFDTAFAAKSTTNLTEGTNLYYTTTRANSDFDTRLATKSTTNLAEGTNLYYTDTRVGTYLTANSYATQSYVSTQINNLVSGAPGLLDTLDELAAALGDDPNFATTLSTALSNRLRIDIGTQGLTSTQQGYGRTNLGLGSLATLSSVANANITDLAYSKLTGVPSTFTPSAHTHVWTDITDRPTNLSAFTNGPGYLTGITSSQVTTALGYTPYNATNPLGYITGITSSNVTTALGYTPYNSTNPSGYISSYTETDTLATVTARGATTTSTIIINAGAVHPLAISSSQRYQLQIRNTNNSTNSVYGWWWFMDTNFNMGFHADGASDRFTLTRDGNLSVSGTLSASGYNDSNWNTAYGWGNHASAGYITSSGSITGNAANITGAQIMNGTAVSEDSAFPGLNQTASYIVTSSTGGGDGYIQAWRWTGGGYVTQFYTDVDPTGIFALRHRNDAGTWGSWYRLLHSGNISSYAITSLTDTLATVTGRGATTSTAITISNTLTVGSTLYANTGNEYLRNTAGAVNNAQFQTWFNSAGTRRGYFGYGSGGSNTLELNNESGGQVIFNGGDIITNGNYFRMKGAGGSAEFIWYKDYSGSPSEPGFVINNRAGTTTFYHNANGGGTGVSGSFTAAGAISASNFSGSHSGSSSGTNTGDQSYVASAGKILGYQRGSFTVGGNTNTFYPVAFQIGSGATGEQGISVLQIERGGYDEPGYSNYTFSTFHCRIRAKADGWGYGASYVQVEANAYTQPMLAEVTQQNQTSQLIVWLRGGCAYRWMDIEGSWTLNFGNPSGTSYTTFNGNAVYNSTTTNNIGSNFKYQQGWGNNYISGTLTAGAANIGSLIGGSRTLNVSYSIGVRANLTGTEQEIFHVGNTGSGVNDGYMRLLDSGTAKVLIAANNARGGDTYFNGGGNFGINTDAPSSKLEVFSGSTTADALTLSFTTGADNRQTGIFFKGGPYPYARIVGGTSSYGPDQGFIAFYTNYNPSGAASTSGYCLERVRINPNGSIVATGDITAFGSPSDIKLKNIKEVVPNALQSILKLNGYRFDWKDVNHLTKIKEDIGVIAQEVEKVLPELARTNDDGTMSVRYQGLTAVLIEAVKELKAENDALKEILKRNNII